MPDGSAQQLYAEALASIEREAYTDALRALGEAARQGHALAQYRLGVMYANAEGVSLNYKNAAEWIEKAAVQGLPQAQSLLAWLFAGGYGVVQSDSEAGRWYLKAAEQGAPKDQYTVATMYRWGRFGVGIDKVRMLDWYQRSANQGFAPAQLALGKLLATGKHVPADPVTAYQWLSLAMVNGSDQAGRSLQDLSRRMTRGQIETAQQQIFDATGTQRGAIAGRDHERLL